MSKIIFKKYFKQHKNENQIIKICSMSENNTRRETYSNKYIY